MINKFRYKKPPVVQDNKDTVLVNKDNVELCKNSEIENENVTILDAETKKKLKVSFWILNLAP